MSDGPDFTAITGRQQQTWATGDFNVIALSTMQAADSLVAACDVRPNQKVLDIACGSGNVALSAARRFADAIGLDYVPALVERARQRAAAEGSGAEFVEGDAQALPFADGQFDVVMSVFGVMFAPDQARAAAELLRVCRVGGRIALANWTPDGYGGEFFRAVAKHVPPPPPGLHPPVRWGTSDGLRDLLGPGASAIKAEMRTMQFYYRSVDHVVSVFTTWFGPTARAHQAADDAGKEALRADLAAIFQRYNRAGDGSCIIDADYLQVLATRS